MKMRDDEKTRSLGLVSDLSEKLFALPFISDDPENRELQKAYYQVQDALSNLNKELIS